MNFDSATFLYFSEHIFPKLSEAKRRGGIFNGPDVQKIDYIFEKQMTSKEKKAGIA